MNDFGMVSVVVPVYNVEKYLRECLDSVINQTYKNLQIILVNDGSTDNSGAICDEYAQKDNRITVVHQKNAGAGAAKNAGLDLIKGDFFIIADSDDYIETNTIEESLYLMNEYKVDIVQFLWSYAYVDGSYPNYNLCPKHNNKKLSAEQFLAGLVKDWKYAVFANKIFRTQLLKDIRFYVGNSIDDEFFTYKVIGNSKSVYVSDKVFYNYRMRKSSVMNNSMQDRLMEDRIDCFLERYEFIKSNYPRISNKYYDHLADTLLVFKSQANSSEFKERLDELINTYPYHKPNIFKRLLLKKPNIQKHQPDKRHGDINFYFD